MGWTYVSREEAERRRGFNRIEHKDRREGLDSGSLRFLRLISGASVSNFSGREAILLRHGYGRQVGWTLVSREAVFVSRLRRAKDSYRRRLNRRERRDRKGDLDSGPLCSLRSLWFVLFGRGFQFNRRERRDRKGDIDSDPLCSLRSLRFVLFDRGFQFNRRERRERREHREHRERRDGKEDIDPAPLCSLRSLWLIPFFVLTEAL